MKSKQFIVDCQVYPFQVLCYFENDSKNLFKYLSKHESKKEFKKIRKYKVSQGLAFITESNHTVLWIKKLPESYFDFGVLSHEIYHCVCFILDKAGIEHKDNTEESYAYLIQYLTIEIMKGIDKLRA